MTGKPDPRLNPYRPDLAAAALRGVVEAPRYAEPRDAEIVASAALLMEDPDDGAQRVSEALFGEAVSIFDTVGEWSWIQLGTDSYVGYVRTVSLGPPGPAKTHRVAAARTHVYAAPDLKSPGVRLVSLGARLSVTGNEAGWSALAGGGFARSDHLARLDRAEADPVAVGERFAGTPYFWGGRTSLGIDCSGLVQISLAAAGIAAPRDSDMQERLGTSVPVEDVLAGRLRRGDLVFWKGHVGFAAAADVFLHADASSMRVVAEPLAAAVERIAASGLPVRSVRRVRPG